MIVADATKGRLNSAKTAALPGLLAVIVMTVYTALVLQAESEWTLAVLLAVAAVATLAGARFGLLAIMARSYTARPTQIHLALVLAVIVLTAYFYDDHFALFLLATVLVYSVVCLGLNVQFGYAGILNFAGAAFFGVGCYTSAVLTKHTAIPHLLILVIGGVMAALIGSVLVMPVLRTRGHYGAVITIGFGILFKTFLEANDTLGGPQGLAVGGMKLFGWEFNSNIDIGDFEASFYVNYVILSLLLAVFVFALVRRIERSWIGLNLDAIRLDETAAACFGVSIARWRITAFTVGNFLVGLAGSLYGMMLGFIAPTNFTFADSLVLVSIILLGGLGSLWGVVVATAIVIILPEKLQAIQEYRFLLYAVMVILMLLFRPQGLVPRPIRSYFPDSRVE